MGWGCPPRGDPTPEVPINRLVLWNIDLTLLDVGRVTREAYAEAFRRVTGRSLRQLPQMNGRMESEIFFAALALNEAGAGAAAGAVGANGVAGRGIAAGQGGEDLLARFSFELANAFAARRDLLPEQGRLLPGAAEAVAGLAARHGVVQTVLTGGIKPNAVEKLRAFGLEQFFDVEIGGYGSQVYPKGVQLMMTRSRAADKYGTRFDERSTVYIADSARDVAAPGNGGAA